MQIGVFAPFLTPLPRLEWRDNPRQVGSGLEIFGDNILADRGGGFLHNVDQNFFSHYFFIYNQLILTHKQQNFDIIYNNTLKKSESTSTFTLLF